MNGSPKLVEVDRGLGEEAAGVLTGALLRYPTMRWVCRGERPGFEKRLHAVYRVALANDRVGNFDVSLVEDFLYALAQNAGLDLHVSLAYGQSPHHAVEAIFKGLARSLRQALERDPRQSKRPHRSFATQTATDTTIFGFVFRLRM